MGSSLTHEGVEINAHHNQEREQRCIMFQVDKSSGDHASAPPLLPPSLSSLSSLLSSRLPKYNLLATLVLSLLSFLPFGLSVTKRARLDPPPLQTPPTSPHSDLRAVSSHSRRSSPPPPSSPTFHQALELSSLRTATSTSSPPTTTIESRWLTGWTPRLCSPNQGSLQRQVHAS